MKRYKLMMSAVALMLASTSCSDYFLNLEPTDTQTEANYIHILFIIFGIMVLI